MDMIAYTITKQHPYLHDYLHKYIHTHTHTHLPPTRFYEIRSASRLGAWATGCEPSLPGSGAPGEASAPRVRLRRSPRGTPGRLPQRRARAVCLTASPRRKLHEQHSSLSLSARYPCNTPCDIRCDCPPWRMQMLQQRLCATQPW